MPDTKPDFTIGIPIYQGVDLLDVAAPYEIFNWMGEQWDARKTRVLLVAESKRQVSTRDKLRLTADTTFEKCPPLDLLFVPGGDPKELMKRMQDRAYLGFLCDKSKTASYVASVCEGALLLASAGLLDGYKATTHWAFVPYLKLFPRIKVAHGYPRFVRDRNRVTGGGISSGFDESLKLVELISSKKVAEQVQLTTQYFPKPPVNSPPPTAPKKACLPRPGKPPDPMCVTIEQVLEHHRVECG